MNAKSLILLVLSWAASGAIASAQLSVKFDAGYPLPGNCKITGVGTVTYDKTKYTLQKVTLIATPTGGGQGGQADCTINFGVDRTNFHVNVNIAVNNDLEFTVTVTNQGTFYLEQASIEKLPRP